MPVLPSCLLEPLWDQFAALLPEHVNGHPLGCHNPRIADRVVFEHVIAALVHGSGYERVAKALITQLNGNEPTSSSSAPSLMARMLEALDVTDASRVLELGIGTGYNAALLCEGLSDEQVMSVDIDPGLVEHARLVLAGLGRRPTVYTADGDGGVGSGIGRFDRLIATYGVPRIPSRWLSLVAPGGVIVASLYREQPVGSMVRLIVESPARAVGRFLPLFGGFMPTRRRPSAGYLTPAELSAMRGASRVTALPALTLGLATEPWHFLAALALGDVQHLGTVDAADDGRAEMRYWLLAPDGSWASQSTAPDGQVNVREGGPRRLWSEPEAAQRRWEELGNPERERFGWTVTPAGQELWLDEQEHRVSL